jgi:hypothetical protein
MNGSHMKRAKPLHQYRLQDGDQIPTRPTTVREIMNDPKFALGVADARAGRSYPSTYDDWEETNNQWSYERGRTWARLTPRNVPLKINGQITPQALLWFKKHRHDIL